jgi:hypothetical protein
MFDGDAFDAGALGEDGFVPAELGVGWALKWDRYWQGHSCG